MSRRVLRLGHVVYARSLLYWTYMVVSIPILFVGALLVWGLTFLFDRQRRVLHAYSCLWAGHYLWVSPFWEVSLRGRENIDPRRAYVWVANHQSLGDILALFSVRRHFKWVSKASVFKVPFLGWNMWLNDYVRLVRGEGSSIDAMMAHCVRHLRAGSSVALFPEGRRARDGRLQPFKHGAFTLAKDTGVPVVPIVIEGTRTALPADRFWLRRGASIQISVLPPVDSARFATRDALRDHVRGLIITELARLRGEPEERVVSESVEAPPAGAWEPQVAAARRRG